MPSGGAFSKSAISRAVGVVAVAGAASIGCEDGTAPPSEPPTAATSASNPALPGIERPDPELVGRLAQELQEKGASYEPRAEHRSPDGAPKFVNRLIAEQSPYLLQHAHNPVNWFAWGDEAFERARAESKPVLLSIGYSTCHWCHVMERESFEDIEIATLLNQRFICIKVDREERPDVDSVYMSAVQMLTGRGGWPMTVALTADREPFFAGTYFPARDGDRGSAKGFITIVGELSERYAKDRDGVVATAQSLSRRIAASAERRPAEGVPGPELLSKTAAALSRLHDATYGGFGGAPKFPTPVRLDFMLRYARRSGDRAARDLVLFTLDKMADGGIRDHVGGGFHRYSTDRKWLVPHFEKMLYDNAQLAVLYLDAFQTSGEARYREVATEILDYVAREMTHPDGGFYSATDADSLAPSGDMEEGLFFTWTPKELVAALGEERAATFGARYGVTERGHLEGRSVLSATKPIAALAKEAGLEEDAIRASLAESRERLYEVRAKRPAPICDDKIVTSYNGLMISAFARGASTLGRADYAGRAERAAAFVLESLRGPDGRLLRSFREGRARHAGYLDDYAFLIQGFLDLYEATGEVRWLRESLTLQATLDEHYADEGGGYFMTADDAEQLLVRDRPSYDGAEPSGNSVALSNLLRLGVLTSSPAPRARAEALLRAMGPGLEQRAAGMTRLLAGLDFLTDRPREVVLVRPAAPSDADPELEKALLAAVQKVYLPNRALILTTEGPALAALASVVPLVEDKRALRDKTTAFVCSEGRCERPTSDPAVLAQQLGKIEPLTHPSGAAPEGAPL